MANKEIDRLFKAKISFHNELAKMSFEKKIEILVQLQRMANGIQAFSTKQKKRRQKIWEI
ncbi:hypothetical protein KAW08_05490 [bacterium]|nr:hypothetical protein [bacterium]